MGILKKAADSVPRDLSGSILNGNWSIQMFAKLVIITTLIVGTCGSAANAADLQRFPREVQQLTAGGEANAPLPNYTGTPGIPDDVVDPRRLADNNEKKRSHETCGA